MSSSVTSTPSGLLVVDKPCGPTSHDVVGAARRLYRTRAVGHAGTLDPLASGVLLLLLGEATKLSNHLTSEAKRYRATIAFGFSTDSLDAEGTETERVELTPGWLDRTRLTDALAVEHARVEQVPPAYSAIKVQGQRAHRMSRRGETVALAPRPVTVHDIELLSADTAHCVVELTVSKGYYVRSFARDLVRHLGVPGHLAALRRVASGGFSLTEAHAWPLDEPPPLIPLAEAAARAMPAALLNPEGTRKAAVGQRLVAADFSELPATEGIAAWFDETGRLLALGEARGDGGFAVVRGFRS